MTNKILTILSIPLLLFACKDSDRKKAHYIKDAISQESEIQLISQTLPKLIERRLEPPPPYPGENKQESEKYRKEYQKRLDTTQLTLYLFDTLIIPDLEYIDMPDTAFDGLGQMLISDSLTSKAIDLDKINCPASFKLLRKNPGFKSRVDRDFSFLGYAKYSRIIFNKDFTKALFYFQFTYGSLGGSGSLYYSEKINEHWIILRQDLVWVS